MLSIGTRLGTYEVVAPLGAGGMGEVYRARDTRLDREVAIKVLPELFVSDPDRVARFTREAKTLAALNHPNIAAIHGLEESNGVSALVLELVEGPTLAELLASRADGAGLPLDEVRPIARQIAEALEAAHEAGIVHRDLKPANVKLRPDGTVKVLDFGLARAMSPDPAATGAVALSQSPTLITPAVTQMGVLLGTAAYMSPEQARGRTVDKRADIWAFGCVVYELLTGRQAFPGAEVADTLVAVLSREPDWTALPPDAADALTPLLRRCLVKDSRTRLRDAGEARIALEPRVNDAERAEAPVRVVIPPARMSLRDGWRWAAAGALVAAIAAGAWSAFRPEGSERTEFRATIMLPDGTQLSTANIAAQMFAVSPDGRHIALVVEDADGRRSLWVRPTNDLNARPLRGTEGALAPFWSPDSRSIGFATSGRLKRVEIAGGLPVPICPLPVNATEFSAGSWAPDGTVIFSTVSSQGVLGVSAKGDGQPQQITEIDRARGERIHTQPSFLPDGRHFLYLAGGAGEPLGLYVASLDGADRVRVLERGSRALFAAAHLFFTRDQELVAQPFNLDRLTLEGEVTTVADVINVGGISGAVGAFSVSAAGAVLYQGLGADSSVRLEWRDRDGTPQGTLGDVGSYIGPELSPDGLRTAIQLVGGEPGNRSDLLIFDNTRQRSTQFTSGPGQERFPVWSPDGNRLAFAAWEPSTVAEHRLRVKALAAADDSPLIAEEIFGLPTSWSRDNVLLFTRTVGSDLNRGDVFSVSLSGEGRPRAFRATPARELGGVFSPDGRWIAYSSNESGRDEVYVAGFQDAADPQLVSSGGGLWAQWRSNGRELFYLSLNGELMAVDVTLDGSRLRFGKPRELFPINIGTPFAPKPYSPASDGQKFLITTSVGKATPAPLTLFVRRW